VNGHVPDADHRHRLGVQLEPVRVHVRVSAVPVDEVGGRVATGQVLAWYPEPPVAHRAGRVDNRVITGQQVISGHVVAEVYRADELDALMLEYAPQVIGDRLDRLVVGRHAIADQAIRRRQPVKYIDADWAREVQRSALLDQGFGRVQAGRARADYGDVERI